MAFLEFEFVDHEVTLVTVTRPHLVMLVAPYIHHFFELQAIIALLPLTQLGCRVFGLVSFISFLDSLQVIFNSFFSLECFVLLSIWF